LHGDYRPELERTHAKHLLGLDVFLEYLREHVVLAVLHLHLLLLFDFFLPALLGLLSCLHLGLEFLLLKLDLLFHLLKLLALLDLLLDEDLRIGLQRGETGDEFCVSQAVHTIRFKTANKTHTVFICDQTLVRYEDLLDILRDNEPVVDSVQTGDGRIL